MNSREFCKPVTNTLTLTVVAVKSRDAAKRLYAVVGGLLLVSPNEDIIQETIAELHKFGLKVIIPGHCTGWRAIYALVNAFGEEVVDPLAVGSRQTL